MTEEESESCKIMRERRNSLEMVRDSLRGDMAPWKQALLTDAANDWALWKDAHFMITGCTIHH